LLSKQSFEQHNRVLRVSVLAYAIYWEELEPQ